MTRIRCADPESVPGTAQTHPVMTALARHIPLTLLMDLGEPAGPDSRHALAHETADVSWLSGLAFPADTPPGRERSVASAG